MHALDFSFFTWDVFRSYILSGMVFSFELTAIATIGGIVFGTVLALMRLSGIKPLELVAATYVNGMRSVPLLMVLLWFFLLVPLLMGDRSAPSCRRSSPSSPSRRRTSARSCAPASSRSPAGRSTPARRWA